MNILGNILWLLFGGIILATIWIMCALLCFCTIIGIPGGVQYLKFAKYVLWPFGKTIEHSSSGGHILLNILWIILFGWELAVISVVIGLIWCVTIIGIPFGMQSMKFAQLALLPFGSKIVHT